MVSRARFHDKGRGDLKYEENETNTCEFAAAKAALRRKKAHERSLEQTEAQIGTLEQQINAIESANINRSTLQAMENASAAMKNIHGKLTPEKVDETMYVMLPCGGVRMETCEWNTCADKESRDKIREQNELSDEIVNALTTSSLSNAVDEQDLEDELDQLQQEQLDEAMLKTGTVPVLASPPSQDRELPAKVCYVKSKCAKARCSRVQPTKGRRAEGRRRGRRAAQAAGRNGHVEGGTLRIACRLSYYPLTILPHTPGVGVVHFFLFEYHVDGEETETRINKHSWYSACQGCCYWRPVQITWMVLLW